MEDKKAYINLFSGCEGFSLERHNAGWKGTIAIDKDVFKHLSTILEKKSI